MYDFPHNYESICISDASRAITTGQSVDDGQATGKKAAAAVEQRK